MLNDLGMVLRHGWALWRRDRALLGPLSGLLLFVPQWSVLLLIPELPRMAAGASGTAGGDGAMDAWADALSAWFGDYGAPYLAAIVLGQLGSVAIAALYLARPSVDVGGALARAVRVLLRFLLAQALVALPLGMAGLLLLSVPGGLMLAVAPVFYVLGRTCLVAAVVVAEPGVGAVNAVVRSWTLTRRRGLRLAILIGGVTLAGQVAGAAVMAIDHALKAAGTANPLTLAIVDAIAAGATWAAGLTLVLVEVLIYRRLVRQD